MSIPGIQPRWFREVEQTSEFVTIVDSGGRLLYVNHPQPGLEDYHGRPVFDFVDPAHHDTLRAAVEGARDTGLPQHFDSFAAGPSGERSHYSNWVMALAGPGQQDLVAFVATDVTHRGRIEAELELSETTLRSLVDNSPDAILIVDRQRRILFINRLEHGFEREQVLGVPAETFVPERDRRRVVEATERVLRTGEIVSYDTRLETPQGVRHFTTRVAPIVREGEIDRLMLVATDITEQCESREEHRRLAEQLQQAQKMEALGQLTGGIAHDFNNLLTAISGNLELATMAQGDRCQRELHIQEALEATRRASTLTQRLLAFSRKQSLRPQHVDASGLLTGMRSLLQRTLGETVAVRTSCSDEPLTCHVDPSQLENAILNLALNARDAMPRGGELEIRCSVHSASVEGELQLAPGDYVLIEVRDTGRGMAPGVLAQAFEPFFTTKDVGQGSGLGLSMVYGFVRQSGGHVRIQSELRAGTVVEVFLPRMSEPPAPLPSPATTEELAQGNGERVLIVEDDAQVRALAARVLRGLGYRTEVAGHAEEALARLAREPRVALVLSDVVLPGGTDGFELAERARRTAPDLPLLFVSGYPEEALIRNGRQDGGDAILRKPYTTEQLASAVRRALGDEP